MKAKMMPLIVLAIGVWLVAEAEKTFGKGEGLIAHYLFDEGEGVLIRDRSGKGHHGKIIGAVRWVKTPTGTALSFNGEDTYIDCVISDTLNMTKAGTIEIWFNMQSAQGGLVGFFTGSRWVDERLVIAFDTWEGRKMFIWCLADGETYQSGQMTIPTEGIWTHVALTYDGSIIQVFKDGLLFYAVPQHVVPEVKGVPLWIGQCLGLGKEYFHGLISEVRIYDRALSEEEIFSYYAAKARVLGLPITTRVRQEGREMAKWTPPKTARQKGVRWLNNLVAELLSVTSEKGKGEWTFTNPRDGWVFISSTARVRGKERLWLTLDEEPREQAVIVHQSGQPETLEAMRYLKAGGHKIRLGKEGRPTLERLIVRAIPELIFCKFQYDPYVRPHGPYDWGFLKKHILPHVNTIVGSGADEHRPFVEEWKKQGKRWIVEVPATPYFKSQSADEAYRYWTECIGFKNQIYDGIIVDEFFGGDEERYLAIIASVRRLHQNEQFKGKVFYPYCGSMYGAKLSEEFIKTVMDSGWRFAWERYLQEQPNEEVAKRHLEIALSQEMQNWQKALPNCVKHLIVCFGYFQTVTTESLNVFPNVDYKVWMDMQFHHVATDPAFFGTYGLMEYTCGYADEETVRWAAKLYRHYGIEGKTEMLSKRYGFKYRLDHIQNPDFDEGTKGWVVEAAEEGSVGTKRVKGYSWLQGRYPRTNQGDTFLWMKRSAKKPNIVWQEIKNLKPGRLYSLKMVTADYGELMKGESVKQKHAVSIRLEGVEIIPEKCFQFVIANNYAHHWGPFNDKHPFWMNYHFRVFRAKDRTAKLTISDWADERETGGPIGQELMVNFVEVQPYLED
jgi:hypothetical protein